MHEGPTENRLGELGSLYKYYYYYYCYYYIIIKMIVLCPCHSHNARILIANDKQVNKIPLKKFKKIGVTIPNS